MPGESERRFVLPLFAADGGWTSARDGAAALREWERKGPAGSISNPIEIVSAKDQDRVAIGGFVVDPSGRIFRREREGLVRAGGVPGTRRPGGLLGSESDARGSAFGNAFEPTTPAAGEGEKARGVGGASTGFTPRSGDEPLVGFGAERFARAQTGNPEYQVGSTNPQVGGNIRGDLAGTVGLRGLGAPKCDILVSDALAAAGAAPFLENNTRPRAEDWGNPNVFIQGYIVIDASDLRPGDVISNGRHVGLYSPSLDDRGRTLPGTVSAATPSPERGAGGVIRNDWGFRPGESVLDGRGGFVVRRWVGDLPQTSPQARIASRVKRPEP